MKSAATTVKEYLRSLPEDRREAISAVRDVILANLPKGYAEVMQYGMIGYVVPHDLYPAGYSCKPSEPLSLAALGSQKNHMSIHLCSVYGQKDTEIWFRKAFLATGKKLDMGKACVRFKKLDQLPLEVIGQVFARTPVNDYIAGVEAALAQRARRKKRSEERRVGKE